MNNTQKKLLLEKGLEEINSILINLNRIKEVIINIQNKNIELLAEFLEGLLESDENIFDMYLNWSRENQKNALQLLQGIIYLKYNYSINYFLGDVGYTEPFHFSFDSNEKLNKAQMRKEIKERLYNYLNASKGCSGSGDKIYIDWKSGEVYENEEEV